jgi:hypothetical protein
MPCRFRLIRFRSPLLTESLLFSLPRGTEMVHFPRFAPLPYFIQAVVHEYCSCGFPHSEICGSKDACSLPQLIAACHVLHRLEVPRHPPCALSSLTVKLTREQRSRENLSVPNYLLAQQLALLQSLFNCQRTKPTFDEASKLQPSTGRLLMFSLNTWLPTL